MRSELLHQVRGWQTPKIFKLIFGYQPTFLQAENLKKNSEPN